jgi:hypothetical protein
MTVITVGREVNIIVDPSELVVVMRDALVAVVSLAVLLTLPLPAPPVELTTKFKCATVILQSDPNCGTGVLSTMTNGFFHPDEIPNVIGPDCVMSLETVKDNDCDQ